MKSEIECVLEDIQYRENVTSSWSINDQGEPQEEIGMTDGDFVCYFCNNCYEEFNSFEDVQEHIGVINNIKFYGIDNFNRPVFKSVDKPNQFYGATDRLFDFNSTEKQVLETVKVEDLVYFGFQFNCEPYGTEAHNLNIIKEDSK